MPDTSLSAAIAEAYACAPSDRVILHTLEIRHPAFIDESGNADAIRVVRDHADLVATLEADAPLHPGLAVTFLAYAWEMDLPEVAQAATPSLTIKIDNVSRLIVENIQRAVASPSPIYVTYRPYLSTDLSGPQISPVLTLEVTEIFATSYVVTATARFADLSNKLFPGETYTPLRFPGLVQ